MDIEKGAQRVFDSLKAPKSRASCHHIHSSIYSSNKKFQSLKTTAEAPTRLKKSHKGSPV